MGLTRWDRYPTSDGTLAQHVPVMCGCITRAVKPFRRFSTALAVVPTETSYAVPETYVAVRKRLLLGMTKLPPSNAGKTFRIEPLTAEEVRSLRAAVSPRYTTGKRLRALIAVLYGGGLRLQEALDLLPRDVDMENCQATIHRGKGSKRRVAGLDPGACADLAAWMEHRKAIGLTGRHPVFAAYSAGALGKPLDQRYVRTALARAATKAGIEKRVHPHGLRHSHAVGLEKDGVPLTVIQRQLGHASLDGTANYLARLTNEEVVDIIRARPDWTKATVAAEDEVVSLLAGLTDDEVLALLRARADRSS